MNSTFTATTTRPAGRTMSGLAVGACAACGAGLATENVDAGQSGTCGHCGARVRLAMVYGERSDVPCDGRCMGATGPFCSCSCGGRNHGRWFVNIQLVPVFQREQATAAQARRRAGHDKRTAAKAQKAADAAAAHAAEFAAQMSAHPELSALLGEDYCGAGFGFVTDMRERLNAREILSPRQIDAIVNMVRRDQRRAAEQTERQTERDRRAAAAIAAGVRVPAGRITFTGVIINAKLVDLNAPTYHERSAYKILVESADGWRVYGTAPSNVTSAIWHEVHTDRSKRDAKITDLLRGRTVTLTATVKPSATDQLFGFYSRPAGALADAPAAGQEPAAPPAVVAAPAEGPDLWAELEAAL